MKLLDELKAVTGRLDSEGIDYALCGGLAMAVYAMPRATLDIDLMIENEALDRVRRVVSDLGFTISGLPMEFKDGRVKIHRLSKMDPESRKLLVLDLMIATDALREAWESRRKVNWAGGVLNIIAPKGMISLKSMRKNGQDLQDIAYLEGIADEN